jgi:hypothetical protein
MAAQLYPTEVVDFIKFDYKSFDFGFQDKSINLSYGNLMHPLVPFAIVTWYYLFSRDICGYIRDYWKIDPKAVWIKNLTKLHSIALAAYSGWTFVNTVLIFLKFIGKYGVTAAICDSDDILWVDYGLGWWVTHFYLSKYWEFLDTWIVVLKGVEPMFLQTYHHAGIVILMWGVVVTHNTGAGLITMGLNSFIHTVMYSYYSLAAFGYKSPLKSYLTMAQITQFFVGYALSMSMYGCVNPAQTAALVSLHLYTMVLIYLFYQFYKKSYTKKAVKKE